MKYNRCFICQKRKKLKAHHVCYIPERKVMVCNKCHAQAHRQVTQICGKEKKRFIRFVIKKMKKQGISKRMVIRHFLTDIIKNYAF